MWRRYLIGNMEFASIVLRQRLRRVFLDTFVHFINEDRFAAELSELTLPQPPPSSIAAQHRGSRRGGPDNTDHIIVLALARSVERSRAGTLVPR